MEISRLVVGLGAGEGVPIVREMAPPLAVPHSRYLLHGTVVLHRG